MQCSHTAVPCGPLQLAPTGPSRLLFRDPGGRSRGRADVSLRTEVLRVRLAPEEREVIRARAEQCRKPVSTFVREVALGSVPRARPRRLEEKAVYHLGRIGNNLNQIARTANATGRLDEARQLDEALAELLDAIRRLI